MRWISTGRSVRLGRFATVQTRLTLGRLFECSLDEPGRSRLSVGESAARIRRGQLNRGPPRRAPARGHGSGLGYGAEWESITLLLGEDGVVLAERVDSFAFGDKRISLPVMGTFELAGGKIAKWRDYFDLAEFERQMAAIQG